MTTLHTVFLLCRERVLKEYEKLDPHERPFQRPAERDHLSDDDDEALEHVQKPALMGASGEEADTDFEPKLRKHLRSRHHHDSVSTQRNSPDYSDNSQTSGRCKACGCKMQPQDSGQEYQQHSITRSAGEAQDMPSAETWSQEEKQTDKPESQQEAEAAVRDGLRPSAEQYSPRTGQWGYVGEQSYGEDKQGSKRV